MTTQWLPRLIAITNAKRFGVEATIDAAKYLCVNATPQSVVIQLREAELDRNELWSLAQALAKLCQTSEQGLAINHRLELALAVGTPLFHRKPSSAQVDELRSALNARFGTSWLTQGWHPANEAPPAGGGRGTGVASGGAAKGTSGARIGGAARSGWCNRSNACVCLGRHRFARGGGRLVDGGCGCCRSSGVVQRTRSSAGGPVGRTVELRLSHSC